MSVVPSFDVHSASATGPGALGGLAPLLVAVFVGFLAIGLALPVLPLHVRDGLGYGPLMVGIVAGCQFAAALIARVWSGRIADARGPKTAVTAGLAGAAGAGGLYALSLAMSGWPSASATILLLGRALLGGAESFIVTGATTWGLARAGDRHAGKVIAWTGTAMFAGLAAGAPLGAALYARGGFLDVALVTTITPMLTLCLIVPLRRSAATRRSGADILSVVGRIWLPGAGAALSSVGFGAVLTFSSLLFAEHGWTPVWLGFTAYAVALIAARLLFGHLPDRFGGARIALCFIGVEVLGLVLIGMASAAALAGLGAALTGLGYSLVFPGLGVEAVRLAPPESRGVAMGAYTACLDLALGLSGPLLGLVAGAAGLGSAFLASAVAVLAAGAISARLVSPLRVRGES